MPDASLSLQKAIVSTLRGDTGVSAIVGANVFDTVSKSDPFPRITLGEDTVEIERADCYIGYDITIPIHVWSREVGFPQAKRISAAIVLALHDVALTLDDFRLVDITLEGEQYIRDSDGETNHAVLTFRALTEPVN